MVKNDKQNKQSKNKPATKPKTKAKAKPKPKPKPKPKFGKKTTVIEVGYTEVEDLIQETYGLDSWSFVADQECGNDSRHTFKVSGKLDQWEQADLQRFLQNKGRVPDWMTSVLLNDCCAKGIIEPGEYLVSVCW